MSIFKAYDIRGTFPEQLDEDTAYKIGRAYVTLFKPKAVAVGRDMRLSSDKIFAALARGINDQGADVVDIGLCTTPMMYFSVGKHGYSGGIMISASHNPMQYNGFKMVKEGAVPISGDTGIYEMEKLVKANDFKNAGAKGKLLKKTGLLAEYVANALESTDVNKLRKFRIAIDSANAMASPVVEALFSKMDCEYFHLYPELDGTFPNHEANPLEPKNMADLQKKVIKEKADFGVAFDGDSDRVGFVDEKGALISCDLITALAAKVFLAEKKGETILYDLRSSWTVKETIQENGGKAVMCRVGHSLIKEQMRKEHAKFAGELSGHYYLRDNYYTEVPFIVVLKIMELLTREKKPLSELIKPLRRYHATGELNSDVKDKDAKMKELAARYSSAKRIFWLDGVSVEFDDWWFNVRPSNTEPLLRLNLEAKTKEMMEKKRDEVLKIIRA